MDLRLEHLRHQISGTINKILETNGTLRDQKGTKIEDMIIIREHHSFLPLEDPEIKYLDLMVHSRVEWDHKGSEAQGKDMTHQEREDQGTMDSSIHRTKEWMILFNMNIIMMNRQMLIHVLRCLRTIEEDLTAIFTMIQSRSVVLTHLRAPEVETLEDQEIQGLIQEEVEIKEVLDLNQEGVLEEVVLDQEKDQYL